jgi:hypothetical protein
MIDTTEMISRRIRLLVVDAPATGDQTPVIAYHSPDPFYMGGGNEDLLCGHCEWLLAHGVDQLQIPSVVIKCPRCDRHNQA